MSWRDKDGEFANIRSLVGIDDTELRESLKSFGWVEQFPALLDENGAVLVGHRRLKLAVELGISPVTVTLKLGTGDAADAQRLRLAIASNVGHAPMTKDDRKRIAEHLYGEREWTMERIAEALNVSDRTISEDLRNFEVASKSKHAKTATNPKGAGRPKSATKPKPELTASGVIRSVRIASADGARRFYLSKCAADPSVNLDEEHRLVIDGLREIAGKRMQATNGTGAAHATAAEFDLSAAPKTWRERYEAAERRLEKQFEQRVRDAAQKEIHGTWLPQYKETVDKYLAVINSRNGVLTRRQFNMIVSCLHPDSRKSATDEKLTEAFKTFNKLDFVLVSKQTEEDIQRHLESVRKMRKAFEEHDRAREAKAAAAKERRKQKQAAASAARKAAAEKAEVQQ